jgi:rubrerythrin
MPNLKGTKTEANLREAFAAESQASHQYRYFAQKADVEGHPEAAAIFRAAAESETGHAFGHFDFLDEIDDANTAENLRSAIEREDYESTEMFPEFARVAREEGFTEVAAWIDTLVRAERSRATRLKEALAAIEG